MKTSAIQRCTLPLFASLGSEVQQHSCNHHVSPQVPPRRTKQRPPLSPHFPWFHSGFYAEMESLQVDGNILRVCVCVSHLNEGSVPDLAVQCFDVRGQVHVQEEVVLEETPQSLISVQSQRSQNILPCHDLITQRFCVRPSLKVSALTFISSNSLRQDAYLDS